MILTGKCKEDFEKWFLTKDGDDDFKYYKSSDSEEYDSIYKFTLLSFPMQWGVYLEFFDNVGILITDFPYPMSKGDNFWWEIRLKEDESNDWENGGFKTRQEAQKQVILKANEIYNDR